MGLVLFLCSFAAALAVVAATVVSTAPPFAGGILRNLQLVREMLLLVVAVATLIAYAGIRGHQPWLNKRPERAVLGGVMAAGLTVTWVVVGVGMVGVAARALPEALLLVVAAGVRILSVLAPAVTAYASLALLQRRSGISENAG